MIEQPDKPLHWFEGSPGVKPTIGDMFLRGQALRWRDSENEGKNSKFREEGSLDKLKSVVAENRPCVQITAPSGYGLTTLAMMLCKELAQEAEHVLYISMKDTIWPGSMIDLLKKKFVDSGHFQQVPLPKVEHVVLVFDGLNNMQPVECQKFFTGLRSFLTDMEDADAGQVSALFFLPECALGEALALRVPPELCFELQGFAPAQREEWCRQFALVTEKDAVCTLEKFRSNEAIFEQMEHPAVCSLLFRVYADNDALPVLSPNSSLIELLTEVLEKIRVDCGFRDADDRLIKKETFEALLRVLAYWLWQNRSLSLKDFRNTVSKVVTLHQSDLDRLEKLYIFNTRDNRISFLLGFLRDACCAAYIFENYLADPDRPTWFEAFAGQSPTEGLAVRLREYAQTHWPANRCKSAQQQLAKILGDRLDNGWRLDGKDESTAQTEARTANADLCLLAVLNALGDKARACAIINIKGSTGVGLNRWLHRLFGGEEQEHWPPLGLRCFNWLEFSEVIPLDTRFCCKENFEGMDLRRFRWVCFDPTALSLEDRTLRPFLDDLTRFYRDPSPAITCPDGCLLRTDWGVLGKILQRLFNTADKYGIAGVPLHVDVNARSGGGIVINVRNYTALVPKTEVAKLRSYRYSSSAAALHGSGEGLWFYDQAASLLSGGENALDIACNPIEALQGFDLAGLAIYGQLKDTEKRWARERCPALQWEQVQAVYDSLEAILDPGDCAHLKQEYSKKSREGNAVYSPGYAAQRLTMPAVAQFTAQFTATLDLNIGGDPHG